MGEGRHWRLLNSMLIVGPKRNILGADRGPRRGRTEPEKNSWSSSGREGPGRKRGRVGGMRYGIGARK
eukprot:6257535-Pyramimonas_sp.AAC.1